MDGTKVIIGFSAQLLLWIFVLSFSLPIRDFSYFAIAQPCMWKKKVLNFYPIFLGILFGSIFLGHLICHVAQNVDPMDNIQLALLSSRATWTLNFQVPSHQFKPLLKGETIRGVWIDVYKLIILSESTAQNSWMSHSELVS